MACLAAKPIVDGIAQDYRDRVVVMRIDARDAANRELAAQWGLRMTPTYVFFDERGQEVYRTTGSINREHVDALVE
jgi:thioredoxin-related protein